MSPLPAKADVAIETTPSSEAKRTGYDVMLHIYADTERTVAFKKVGNSYKWIHEQELFTGPGKYTDPDDGTSNEQMSIGYGTSPISGGGPVNTVYILYMGDDPTLSAKDDLTLKDVLPVLKAWRKQRPPSR